MFICLFVRFFFIFCLNHCFTPTGSFPEICGKIWLDLAEIFRTKEMFIDLFVCLLVGFVVFCFNHLGTPTGSFSENFVKIRLDLA